PSRSGSRGRVAVAQGLPPESARKGPGGGDPGAQSSGNVSSASQGTGGSGAEGGAGGDGAGGDGEGGGEACDPTDLEDLATNPLHCGRCDRRCKLDNVRDQEAECEDGVCVSACEEGWENVNRPEAHPSGENDGDDGCETAWRR